MNKFNINDLLLERYLLGELSGTEESKVVLFQPKPRQFWL